MTKILVLISLLAFVSCGKKSDENSSKDSASSPAGQSGGTTISGSYTVNGKPAADYYGDFIHDIAYIYKIDGSTHYRFFSLDIPVGDKYGTINLFLYKSGQFKIKYDAPYENGVGVVSTIYTGQWKVDKTKLLIGEFLIGEGMILNNFPTVSFKIISPVWGAQNVGKAPRPFVDDTLAISPF